MKEAKPFALILRLLALYTYAATTATTATEAAAPFSIKIDPTIAV